MRFQIGISIIFFVQFKIVISIEWDYLRINSKVPIWHLRFGTKHMFKMLTLYQYMRYNIVTVDLLAH